MALKEFTTDTGKTVTIAEAEKSDAADLIRYMTAIISETDHLSFVSGEFTKTVSQEEKIIEEHRDAENQIFFVAKVDEQIVGALNVHASKKSKSKHVGEFGVSVTKDWWGHGIASALISSMVSWAKGSGIIRKLNLAVHVDNTRAIELYKKFGFEQEGIIRRDSFINGSFVDSLIMGRLID